MEQKRSPAVRGASAGELCLFCKKPFPDRSEKELHVSLLGAPAAFHRACFEQYQRPGD